jgi:peptide/nickel transport system ATP-binding protein
MNNLKTVSAGGDPTSVTQQSRLLLQVQDLKMYFPMVKGIFGGVQGYVKAADEVSFEIQRGETLGLVGESGCGKTTVGRTIVSAYQPTDGAIIYHGGNQPVDLTTLKGSELTPYRREIRMIFQDPYSSLNPRMPVFEIVGESLRNLTSMTRDEKEVTIRDALVRVGLRPEYIRRYPHAFSGGERQRIGIARALVTNPKLVVCDEAVSGLDVSVRAQVLNLLEELRTELDLTYLFVSHDLSVIRYICDRIVVMYVGKLVESAPVNALFRAPKHPYTEALLSAVPIQDPVYRSRGDRVRLVGEVADPSNPPSGCYFHPRCSYVQDRCKTEAPPLREMAPGHHAACHFAEELELQGVRTFTEN